jgi:hypothetical protein
MEAREVAFQAARTSQRVCVFAAGFQETPDAVCNSVAQSIRFELI